MWKYDSPIGTFYIKHLPDGEYVLEHEGMNYDQCESPQILADNFFHQHTGSPWDCVIIDYKLLPKDLGAWTRC